MKVLSKKWAALLLMLLTAAIFMLTPRTAQAASFKNSKPKITEASYQYDTVSLQWSKVKGAKKYEIQRSLINPKTGKGGKWKTWAKTNQTSLKKKGSGDYLYRVRAVKGKTASKWSATKRIFAAYAKILGREYAAAGYLYITVEFTNKTKSPMGLKKGFSDYSTVYFFDETGQIADDYQGALYSGSLWTDDYYFTDTIPAGKSKQIQIQINISSMTWWDMFGGAGYENYAMAIKTGFYPNPTKENTKLNIIYTNDEKLSGVG